MDTERFGKALGWGVRQAGKALFQAADAAARPAPAARVPGGRPRPTADSASGRPARPEVLAQAAHPSSAQTTHHGSVRRGSVREGVGRFTSSVVRPARRAAGVLWLEVTGFLFGLFAALATLGVWAGRAHLRPGPGQAHELAGVGMLLVFGWFAVSNFLRARRRARRP